LPALIPDITELNAGTALDGIALIWDSMELKAGTPVGSRVPVGSTGAAEGVGPALTFESSELGTPEDRPDGRLEDAPSRPDCTALGTKEAATPICDNKELIAAGGTPPGTDVAPNSRELTTADGRFEIAPGSPDAGLPGIELAPAICESKELTTPAGRPEG
jgi:hypothetical protein